MLRNHKDTSDHYAHHEAPPQLSFEPNPICCLGLNLDSPLYLVGSGTNCSIK